MEGEEEKQCPKCGRTDKQIWTGYNRSGTRRAQCVYCHIYYTANPKEYAYTKEEKKEDYSGASGRAVGRLLGMSKANVYRWQEKKQKKLV